MSPFSSPPNQQTFNETVWQIARMVPPGRVTTYGQIASMIPPPGALTLKDYDALDSRKDPRGRPYYWIGGEFPTGIPEDGSDVGALTEGYVSVTPLQLDLTAYKAMEKLNTWNWK